MSYKSQSENMTKLAELLSHDLGYIYGARESGPNGAKRDFLLKGRVFLSALGKELGFTEMRVYKNPEGIACSGSITLMGMWSEGNGLYVQLSQDIMLKTSILYRKIKHMKDYTGGRNNWVSVNTMATGDYEMLLSLFKQMKEASHEFLAA